MACSFKACGPVGAVRLSNIVNTARLSFVDVAQDFFIFYATHVLHALREDGDRHTRCSQLTLLAIRLTLDTRYQLTDTPEPRFTQHFTGYGR